MFSAERTPFDAIGGEPSVRELVTRFYDAMERLEPELTALHACDAQGKITTETRERFALFLIGWLGGPQEYVRLHGHPRLRMRHAHVRVNIAMRDAWLRAMQTALDECAVAGDVRVFVERRLAEVADFMRNTDG